MRDERIGTGNLARDTVNVFECWDLSYACRLASDSTLASEEKATSEK